MKAIINNYKIWINEVEPGILVPKIEEILNKSNYSILNFIEHKFEPYGYTCMWLLAESHLAIHTFPEEGSSYVELSSCNEIMNNSFIKELNIWLVEASIKSSSEDKLTTKP